MDTFRTKIRWLAKPKGRPPIHENIVDLIIEMKRCNQSWGAQRISDELQLLGIKVSKKLLLKILRVNGFLPPRTRFTPPSWSSVLDSFRRYWAMDFTTVFDSKGIPLFIFVMIEVPSRKLILINSTANPNREWILQQFRNSCISGHQFPDAMVHDRDGIFSHWLPRTLEQFGCQSIETPPRSPWENPFVERFHQSIKTEMLNRLVLIDNHHVRELCNSYQDFYNKKRLHQGIGGVTPDFPESRKGNVTQIDNLKVTKSLELNGLVTNLRLAA
jgi:transposase InsO family protein